MVSRPQGLGYDIGAYEKTAETLVPPFSYDFFVSPTGGTGTGSIIDPWSITYAMGTGIGSAQGDGKLLLGSGHGIGLRVGTYDIITLNVATVGTAGLPIIWRNYNGERAHIRGVSTSGNTDDFRVDGAHNWFWGLEFSHTQRSRVITVEPTGNNLWIRNAPTGTKFMHCINHDHQNGFFSDPGTGNVELYGNIVYNVGFDEAAVRGHGHGFYLHHEDTNGTTQMLVEDNISFNQHGACFQAYSGNGTDVIKGIKVRRNIYFNAGAWATLQHRISTIYFGSDVALTIRCEVNDSVLHWPSSNPGEQHITIGQDGVISLSFDMLRNYMTNGGGAAAFANLFIKGRFDTTPGSFKFKDNFTRVALSGPREAVYLRPANSDFAGYDWTNNTWIRDPASTSWTHSDGTSATFANWKTATSLGSTDTATTSDPITNVVVVTPTTRYEAGRGHVWYYNWEGLSRIPVDLSTILGVGDVFQVHDVRDVVPGATAISVFDAPSAGSAVTVYIGNTVYFPTTQVADPALAVNASVNISASTNTAPIQITTATAHGYVSGDAVRIANHLVNTNANGVRVIVVLDSTNFTLTGSTGNGSGINTGTVNGTSGVTPIATAPFFNAFVVRKIIPGS